METENVIKAAIFTCIFLSCICIPVSAYSSDAIGWFEQGNAFMKNKNYSEAIRVYDKAIIFEPDYFEAWNGKADALNRAQQFTEALEASDLVLVLKPDYVQGWINRGYILYNLGRYDEELKAYETAITIDPLSPDAWFNKGYSLAGMKRYDEAIAAFNKVQALNPTFPNLAANKRIAEQNRDATASFNATERTPSTIPTQSQIKAAPALPANTVSPVMVSTQTVPKKSPVSMAGVIGIFSILVVARQIGKKWQIPD
jgi:tetratricopeptide (TPR) repeat protein